MLLGFKRRFEPMILDHTKRHTIRAKRKRPPRVGDRLDCYIDPRQKTMRLLGRWPCVKVDDIRIEESPCGGGPATIRVFINGLELDRDERNALAWADGFRSRGLKHAFAEMADFWIRVHARGSRLHFSGNVIHWNPQASMPAPKKSRSKNGRSKRQCS